MKLCVWGAVVTGAVVAGAVVAGAVVVGAYVTGAVVVGAYVTGDLVVYTFLVVGRGVSLELPPQAASVQTAASKSSAAKST